MKDSTRTALRDGASGLATLFVLGTLLVLASSAGCAAVAKDAHVGHHHGGGRKLAAQAWKPGKRCKTLSKGYSDNVAVIVQKNCIQNGVTSVGMVVLNNEDKGKVAAKDAVGMITATLGFKPILKAVLVGKDKGKVFILAIVTGSDGQPVARR
jgi:hypothetical protein